MKKVIVGFIVGGAMGFMMQGCGGGFSCTSKGSCANDVAPTSADTTACNAAEAGACGSQYKAFGDCVLSNAKCDSAGKTDVTTAVTFTVGDGGLVYGGACGSQGQAMLTCCTSNPTAAGCTTGA